MILNIYISLTILEFRFRGSTLNFSMPKKTNIFGFVRIYCPLLFEPAPVRNLLLAFYTLRSALLLIDWKKWGEEANDGFKGKWEFYLSMTKFKR